MNIEYKCIFLTFLYMLNMLNIIKYFKYLITCIYNNLILIYDKEYLYILYVVQKKNLEIKNIYIYIM